MFLSQFLYIFIIGGFLIILIAPFFKLLKKAGIKSWLSLIPGVNIYALNRLTRTPLIYASLIPLVSLILFLIILGYIKFETHILGYIIALFEILLIVGIFSYIITFPLLSTLTFFIIFIFMPYQSFTFYFVLLLIFLALLHLIPELITWLALFKRLKKPTWQLIFIFLPCLTSFINMLLALLVGHNNMSIFLLTFLPVLFISLVYFYYLGYSPKVIYRLPSQK